MKDSRVIAHISMQKVDNLGKKWPQVASRKVTALAFVRNMKLEHMQYIQATRSDIEFIENLQIHMSLNLFLNQ